MCVQNLFVSSDNSNAVSALGKLLTVAHSELFKFISEREYKIRALSLTHHTRFATSVDVGS